MNLIVHEKPFETANWTRFETFLAFKDYDFPYLVVGQRVQLFKSFEYWKKHNIQVYLACIYATTYAANKVLEFRLRLRGDDVVEHAMIHPGYTIPKGEGGFTIKQIPFNWDFETFYREATKENKEQNIVPGVVTASDHFLFISCLPWVDFSHVMVPIKKLGKDSIPQVMWGKIGEDKEGNTSMAMSIQVHHALMDGIHIARYLSALEEVFKHPEQHFKIGN